MTNNEPIVIERVLNAPVERIWKALTHQKDMKKWYFDIAEFKPEIGFEFEFKGGNEDRIYIHHCKITELVVNRRLKYSWRYEGYDGISFVTFELFDENGGKTRLKLTHEGIETFPNLPDFAKHNFLQGWTHIIGKSLPEFLESQTA
ncbi:MAG TPA: SRPBCC domain-containing protein [Puia sp.]|nr:SRPBCC domain-containing protein [Puia sp.]